MLLLLSLMQQSHLLTALYKVSARVQAQSGLERHYRRRWRLQRRRIASYSPGLMVFGKDGGISEHKNNDISGVTILHRSFVIEVIIIKMTT